jgi:ABC-type multidrug transport system ATPase subunit
VIAHEAVAEPAADPAARAAAAAVVDVRGLTVRYGNQLVLDGVSLSVARGSVYALLGRNGVGKSSLLRCLLGQQKPSAGEARLFGQDAWRGRLGLMERVGYVPEEPDAPPELAARELALFCGRLNVRWNQGAVVARLERFRVPLGTAFRSLSKGQKGAVMLALALGHDPELLLLDDPTLGLDVVARRAVFGEPIGELADRNTTVVVTTHDLAGVEGVADRIGILYANRLVLEGELEALKAEHGGSLEEIFAAVAGDRAGDASRQGEAAGGRAWGRSWRSPCASCASAGRCRSPSSCGDSLRCCSSATSTSRRGRSPRWPPSRPPGGSRC